MGQGFGWDQAGETARLEGAVVLAGMSQEIAKHLDNRNFDLVELYRSIRGQEQKCYFNVDELVGIVYFATCFRISLALNPIIIAAAAVSLSGITGQMELSATKTFFVP
jgi:hypothetical protein